MTLLAANGLKLSEVNTCSVQQAVLQLTPPSHEYLQLWFLIHSNEIFGWGWLRERAVTFPITSDLMGYMYFIKGAILDFLTLHFP